MRFPFHLILVGVGVLVAFGNVAAAIAEPSSTQPQTLPDSEASQKNSLPERWLQSVRQTAIANANRESAKKNSPVDRWLANKQASATTNPTITDPQPAAPSATLMYGNNIISGAVVITDPQPAAPSATVGSSASVPAQPAPVVRKSDVKTSASTSARSLTVTQATPGTIAPPSDLPTPTVAPVEPLGQPLGSAKPGAAPDYLNPEPNPLLIQTNPDEVRLRGIQPITLRQALDLAERNSLSYQAARLQADRSRAALTQAQAALFPSLAVQAGVSRSESASADIANQIAAEANSPFVQQQDPLSRGFNATATLSYDVFTSGRRPAQIRAAAQQLRSDELQAEVAREQLRLDVTTSYYDLQQADANVRIQQAAVRNAQISLRDAQALERAGIGTRFDVLRSQVQLANSQQQLTSAISQQQVSRRRLAQRLNVAPAIDLAAADPVEVAGRWTLSLEQSIVLSFKNRAELEGFLAQREAANQQRRVALSQLGPTLSVSAEYDLLENFRDTVGKGTGYTVQAGLRWTLFDGGAARSSARQQERNIAIAETRFAEQRNQIRFEVEQAFSNLLANQTNIATAQLALTQATEALRLARLRFQAGVGTQTDVINAETDLTNSQGNLVNAILGYNRSLATLQRAVTNLPIPTGATEPSIPTPVPPGTGAIPQTTDTGTSTTTP